MRMPMKPVSRMMSRISVKGTFLKWVQRLALTAHFTFRLAGMLVAAEANEAARAARASRRVMLEQQSIIDRSGTDCARVGAAAPAVPESFRVHGDPAKDVRRRVRNLLAGGRDLRV